MTHATAALEALDRYSRRLARYQAYAPREYNDDSFGDYATIRAKLSELQSDTGPEYHKIMSLLQWTKIPHGTCQPRARRACTHCNAVDDLSEIIENYKGAPVILSRPDAVDVLKTSVKAALTAAPPQSDYVLVPREPTEEMEEAADEVFHAQWKKARERSLKKYGQEAYASVEFSTQIYKAMIAAAPQEPEINGFLAAMNRVIAIAKAYKADESAGGNYKGANESNRRAIEHAERELARYGRGE